MQVAVGWRTQSGSLVQRVATRRLAVVADIPQFVQGVRPETAALLLARATVEEALKAQDSRDPKRPQLMQRIIGEKLWLEAGSNCVIGMATPEHAQLGHIDVQMYLCCINVPWVLNLIAYCLGAVLSMHKVCQQSLEHWHAGNHIRSLAQKVGEKAEAQPHSGPMWRLPAHLTPFARVCPQLGGSAACVSDSQQLLSML